MNNRTIQLLLLGIILLVGMIAPAQSPAPLGFSHSPRKASGSTNSYMNASLLQSTIQKNGSGYCVASMMGGNSWGPVINNYIVDPAWSTLRSFSPNTSGPVLRQNSVLSNQNEVWYAFEEAGNTRFSVLTTQGAVVTQFKFTGWHLGGMRADTVGKVYAFLNDGTIGLMVRFDGTTHTVDFVKQLPTMGVPIEDVGGRFLLGGMWSSLVIDHQGNGYRQLTAPAGYAIFAAYPDHGVAIYKVVLGRMYVARLDSNMAPVWGKSFKTWIHQRDSVVIHQDAHVVPHTNELVVVAEMRDSPPLSSCWPQNFYWELRQFQLGADGSFRRVIPLPVTYNSQFLEIGSSARGEPILLSGQQDCLGPAFYTYAPEFRQLSTLVGSPECGQYPDNAHHQPTSFTPPAGTWSVAAPTTSYSLAPVADNVAILTSMVSINTITQCPPPCANLYGMQVQPGGTVQFADSINGYHSLQYAFGDGTFGSTADPSHTYSNSGNYTVRVIATNECGSDTTLLANVDPCRNATISAPFLSGCVGTSVTFTQGTSYPAVSIEWTRNGVSVGSGNSYSFTPVSTGTQIIGIVFHDGPCHDTTKLTFPVYNSAPVAAFTAAAVGNMTVQFTNQSVNGSNWLWDFGDGGTSTLANPSHTYAGNGPYNVCLTTTNGCGTNTTCNTWSSPFPIAAFTAVGNGNFAQITDQSQNGTTISWDFGDGNTATGAITGHTYATTGTFNICQTVQNAFGSASVCHPVTVAGDFRIRYHLNISSLINPIPKSSDANLDAATAIVGSSNQGQFLMLLDSTTRVMATKIYDPNIYQLHGVASMLNRNFVVVGSKKNSSGVAEPMWMEVNMSGAILQAHSINMGVAAAFTEVSRARYGGFVLTGHSGTGVAARVNESLQLIWSKKLNSFLYGGHQATDSSFWLVGMKPTNPDSIKFMHLSKTGQDMGEHQIQMNSAADPYFSVVGPMTSRMNCSGNIYVVGTVNRYVSTYVGNQIKCLFMAGFSTSLGTSTSTTKWFGNTNQGAPYFDVYAKDFQLQSNGTEIFIGGYKHLRGDINTAPKLDIFHFVQPINFASTGSGLAIGTTNGNEQSFTTCLMPDQISSLIGVENGALAIYHGCYAYTSPYPYSTSIGSGNSRNIANLSTPTTAGGPVSNLTSTATNLPGYPNYACLNGMPCSFTPTVTVTYSGNQATLSATASVPMTYNWYYPGSSCANGASWTVTVACGDTVPVTLIATYSGCGMVQQTFNLSQGGTLSSPAHDPNLLRDSVSCTNAPVTIGMASGYTAPTWSTGATSTIISVTPNATVSVVAQNGIGGCYWTDTATVTYQPQILAIQADTAICPDSALVLQAPPGSTGCNWSTGATTTSISLTLPGTYTLACTLTGGCTATDTVIVTQNTDCVWPGDANHDGLADNTDILAIGSAFGNNGLLRPFASAHWHGQPGPDWLTSYPNQLNHKHADANGDGSVTFLDTSLVTLNYGLIHNKASDITSGEPLWVEPELDSFPVGDTAFFYIHWGSANQPLNSAVGVAYTLQIDPQHLTPGTLYLRPMNSFLGANSDLLPFTYPAGGGVWHLALTRRNPLGAIGEGRIARVGFLPATVVPISSTLGYVPIVLSAATGLDASGDFSPMAPLGDSIFVYGAINGSTPQSLLLCNLQPNPASNSTRLTMDLSHSDNATVRITDLNGRRLRTLMEAQPISAGISQTDIPLEGLSAGLYFVEVRTSEGHKTLKFVVER